jgi:hypothetical protein
VVCDNLPYLVVRRDDASLERAFGPFVPGSEPSVEECRDQNQVHDRDLLARLDALLPISPTLPASDSSLAGHS